MSYANGRFLLDADSHIMELPNFLSANADPGLRDRLPEIDYGASSVSRREVDAILDQGGRHDRDYVAELQDTLVQRGVEHIVIGAPTAPPTEEGEDLDAEERAKQLAKRTYQRSVAVSKSVVNGVRMGLTGAVPKMKRAVQGIVDQVLNNELSLVGLTAIRDYDEYTFTHSVNVCIFSVAIGNFFPRTLGNVSICLLEIKL